MRLRQRPRTNSRIHPQHVEVPPFDEGRQFHIAKLAYVLVETGSGTCPAEEQIAGRLDQALANDDAQGPAAANYIKNVLKAQKAYVVDDQTAYGAGLAAGTGWRLILVASLSNFFFKGCLALILGGVALLRWLALPFLAAFVGGAVLLLWGPG